MRTPLRRQEAPQRQRHADHHGFVQNEQHQRAADDLAQRLRRLDAKQQGAPELRDRRRAQRQNQTEYEWKREQAHAQDDPGPGVQPGDAQTIQGDGDSGAHGRKADDLLGGVRRAPERARRIAQKSKKRDDDEIESGGDGLPHRILRRTQQIDRSGAGETGEKHLIFALCGLKGGKAG